MKKIFFAFLFVLLSMGLFAQIIDYYPEIWRNPIVYDSIEINKESGTLTYLFYDVDFMADYTLPFHAILTRILLDSGSLLVPNYNSYWGDINKYLSPKVKAAMKKYKANVCFTITNDNYLVVNILVPAWFSPTERIEYWTGSIKLYEALEFEVPREWDDDFEPNIITKHRE